jgi:hypothetical protein
MGSYAVLWNDGAEQVEVGKLELDAAGVRFEGERVHEVRYEEIRSVHVGRRPVERLLGRPTLVLGLAAGAVRIGSVDGMGAIADLAARLARRRRG